MTIEDLHSSLNAANGVEGPSRLDSTRPKKESAKSGKPSEPSSAVTPKGYQIQISPEGKSLSSIESDLRLIGIEIERLPDIRRDRVEAAKQRLHEGYYNTEKVVTKTTDKIASDDLTEAMFAIASLKKRLTRLAQNLVLTDPAKEELVKRRLREGFYHTPAGISALVDKILS